MLSPKLASQVSVIVPTHSRAAMLVECLDSLLTQSVNALEIIVVDDASTDDTPSVVARYGEAVRYVRIDKQSGKSAAVNLVLGQIRGEFVWIFDDDDVALPTAIERLSAPLIADPLLAFSFGSFIEGVSSEDGTLKSRGIDSVMPNLSERGLLAPLLEVNFLGGARLLFRTQALRAIGGFNPEYLRSQDYDVAIRMVRHGQGGFAPGGPLYVYRVHQSVRHSADRVTTIEQLESRWLEYDRRIIGALLAKMPIQELLPTRENPHAAQRGLLLQRAGIYASKLMFDEMLQDFAAIGALGDESALTRLERAQVERLFYFTPMYGVGDLLDVDSVVRELRRLGGQSVAIRNILGHAARTAPGRALMTLLKHRQPRRSYRILRTALAFGSLSAAP